MEKQLLIGIPTMGSIHPMLVPHLIAWGRGLPGCTVSFYFTFHVAPVDRARNKIVDYFLKGSFTHLLFIDSDTIPPRNALERLLSHDKDVVSGRIMAYIDTLLEENGFNDDDVRSNTCS